jgi:hypothetical protein
MGALAALLREDVTLEMPPHAIWFAGSKAVLGFLGTRVLREKGRFTGVTVTPPANGQPTIALYAGSEAYALQVLDMDRGGIRRIHVFLQPVPAIHGRSSQGAGRAAYSSGAGRRSHKLHFPRATQPVNRPPRRLLGSLVISARPCQPSTDLPSP